MSSKERLSGLEALPAEIHIILMRQLNSMGSLFALLRASPTLLRVYCCSRDSVYPYVIVNQIGIQFLPIALAAANLRGSNHPISVESIRQYINNVKAGMVDDSTPSVDEARKLLRFHNLVDQLKHDATKRSLELLHLKLSLNTADVDNMRLSPTECFRAMRAFYNWELMSLICKRYQWAVQHENAPKDNDWSSSLAGFLETLEFHEVEELWFAFFYLEHCLVNFVHRVNDDRLQEFIDAGPGNCPPNWRLDPHSMFLARAARHQLKDWASSTMLRENLDTIYEVIEASTAAERLHRLEGLRLVPAPDGFMQILFNRRRSSMINLESPLLPSTWPTSPDLPSLDGSTDSFVETSESTTLGALWACSGSGCLRYGNTFLDGSAVLGFAIWDAERLHRMGLSSGNVRQITSAESFIPQWTSSLEDMMWEQAIKWRAEGLL